MPRTIFATRLPPRAVYFIQTGSSALSNTYCCVLARFRIVYLFTGNQNLLKKHRMWKHLLEFYAMNNNVIQREHSMH